MLTAHTYRLDIVTGKDRLDSPEDGERTEKERVHSTGSYGMENSGRYRRALGTCVRVRVTATDISWYVGGVIHLYSSSWAGCGKYSMSSWRFPLPSRGSHRRTAELSLPVLSDGDPNLPRYSNVSLHAFPVPRALPPAAYTPSASVTSLASCSTAPTYATDDPYARSPAASTGTLTNPPRYAGSASVDLAEDRGRVDGAANSEYTFAIRSGLKSKPWATLRLYEAERPTSRAPKKGRHPRFSNADKMVGSVDLTLPNPETVKSIELLVSAFTETRATIR